MHKINVGANIYPYPMPVTLVGATVEGRANFMAVAWMNRANRNPPLFVYRGGHQRESHLQHQLPWCGLD